MSSVRKKISILFPEQADQIESSELLKTIRFPKNLMNLTNQLPKASYDQEINEDFIDQIKSSTLPRKPKPKKSSDSLFNSRAVSRSKLNTGSKNSEISDRIGTQNSASKPSRKMNRAKEIMKNNLANIERSLAQVKYRDILKKTNNSVVKKRVKKVLLLIIYI